MYFKLYTVIEASEALLEFQPFSVVAAKCADLIFRENANYLPGEGIHFNISISLVYFL